MSPFHTHLRRGRVRLPGIASTAPFLALAGLLLVACGAGSPADLAVLADRADRVAEHLEAGDSCAAEAEAERLRERSRDALAAGTVEEPTADEIETVLDELDGVLSCDEPSEETADEGAPPDEAPDAEEPSEAPDEAPEEDEAPEDEEGEEATDEGADEETGDGRGPDGRGPPGQREGSPGRGGGNR